MPKAEQDAHVGAWIHALLDVPVVGEATITAHKEKFWKSSGRDHRPGASHRDLLRSGSVIRPAVASGSSDEQRTDTSIAPTKSM